MVCPDDDRPFGGADPPAVVFYYSRDRRENIPNSPRVLVWDSAG
jgi:hypothetical protein